ncbi:MAG: hypothetical protein ACOCUP_00375 [bacterium]
MEDTLDLLTQALMYSFINDASNMSGNLILETNNGEQVLLYEILSTGPKLILYYSGRGCSKCFENELNAISSRSYPVSFNNLIIMITGIHYRAFKSFGENLNPDMQIFLIDDELENTSMDINQTSPCLFILAPDERITHFYSIYGLPQNITYNYFKIINKRYFD